MNKKTPQSSKQGYIFEKALLERLLHPNNKLSGNLDAFFHPCNRLSGTPENTKHPRKRFSENSEKYQEKSLIINLIINTKTMNAIDLFKLRNAEYLQYVKDFAAIINLNNPDDLGIGIKLNSFVLKTGELESLYKKALASEKTQELLAIDEKRDNAVNGIYYFLLGHSYHFDPIKKQNAQTMIANMMLYGSGIARLNYQAETATINNLIRDWESKPELITAITAFQLNDWVNELKTANEDFNTKYLSRPQEYGEANPETIKLKREEVSTAYYALRDRIDALHLLVETPPSPYGTVINQLNALIDQYNALLLKRKSEDTDTQKDSSN